MTYAAPRATATPALEGSKHLAEPFAMVIDQPEAVARRILDGIERDARVILPGFMERIFIVMQGVLPTLVDKSIIRQFHNVADRG